MADPTFTFNDIVLPRLLYGTAWKEARTQELTELALQQGFRGVDTANQRCHYHEAAVGQAISVSIAGGLVTRKDLFIQSKFTFRHGQDHRLPYDPEAPITAQVEQSCASSLRHLNVDYIDSYLLHGPASPVGLTPDDWAAWRTMEAIHGRGRVRMLGVSNFNLEQLAHLCERARIRPSFVQNRCYAASGWDRQVRYFCRLHGIVYQGFSLLTANRAALASPHLARIAATHGRTIPQVIFRFAIDVGMIPLTGTTNVEHMRMDLDVFSFQLERPEIEQIEDLSAPKSP